MQQGTTEQTFSITPEATVCAPAVENASLELRHLQRNLLRVVTSTDNEQSLLLSVGEILTESLSPIAIRYFRREDEGKLSPVWHFAPGGGQSAPHVAQEHVLPTCNSACRRGCLQIDRVKGMDGHFAVAVPVFLRQHSSAALALVLPETTRCLERTIVVLQLVSAHLTLWYVVQEYNDVEDEARGTAALVEVVERVEHCESLHDACYTLVGDFQEYLACDLVAVGMRRGREGPCQLEAISKQAGFDRHSDFTRAVEAALDESLLRGTLTCWPPSSDSERHSNLAQRRLCSMTDSKTVVSAPLVDREGETVGAWVFLGDESFRDRPGAMDLIRAAQAPVARCLQVARRSQRGPVTRLARKIGRSRHQWQGRVAIIAVCLLMAVLCLPVQYKVKCKCELQPIKRRFVAAPFDGKLEKALVAPGDVISQGDLLARMDGRDIRWELAGLVAERGRVAKERDVALAGHDTVAAQMAALDLERLNLNIQMLEHRADHLEIASPIGGIVVTGDQEKAEGAPLTIGQVLFEIAPLDGMTAEIAVPEAEIAFVRAELKAVIRLDAYPRKTWEGSIARVHPRSEINDDQNVFIAELALDNSEGTLRPGMKGRAKVHAGRRPLAWNLFHKASEFVYSSLGW